MSLRTPLLNLLSAGLFMASTTFAASPPVHPAFSGLTLCQVTDKAELCCDGKVVGLGAEAALIRLDAAFQCETRDGLAPAVPIMIERKDLKVTSGALTFDHLCTVALTATQCPATQGVSFTPDVQVTVEQPAGTVVLQGTGVVFPYDVVTGTPSKSEEE